MIGSILKETAEKAVVLFADKGIETVKEVSTVFINDYGMRRDSGFNVRQSIKGSFQDTKMYCNDLICGREPRVMKQVVSYNK